MLRHVTLPSVLLLGACAATVPSGPSVLAVPGKDKTFAQFQQDDATCRNYGQSTIGATTPAQAGTNSAVGSSVAGTAIGAAAGALLGAAAGNAGAGAAIGGGTGLLLGTSVGAGDAEQSSGDLQRRYDFGYIQCMTANGENVQSTTGVGYSGLSAYPAYAYPAYTYAPYAFAPPVIGLGFGFGFGGGYGGYYGHRDGYYGHRGGGYYRH